MALPEHNPAQNINHLAMDLQNWKFPWGFSVQPQFTHLLRPGMLCSSEVH